MNKVVQRVVGTLVMAAVILPAGIATKAEAAPAGFVTEVVASGLEVPTGMAFAPDGRIFVAEKGGKVKIIKNGAVLPTPFLDFSSKINTAGDRGLLAIALDPSFASNKYVYLAYTYENSPGNYEGPKTGRVTRVVANGDVMKAGSEVILVGKVAGTVDKPSCNQYAVTADCIPSDSLSHSVGGLRFGPDGKLYASLGDGADFGRVDDNARKALNIDSLAGKILRINRNGTGVSTNPFYVSTSTNANRSKVWTYGHRNSFRFNFRPANSALFFGEVGWFSYEEINVAKKGGNYGWPCREGNIATPGYDCTTTNPVAPIYVFKHIEGNTNAIIGGAFSGAAYPAAYRDDYYFGELGTGKVYRMDVNAQNQNVSVEPFMDNADGPVEFVTGPDGSIYYISIYTGQVRKIAYESDLAPTAAIAATPASGNAPLNVAFSGVGSSDPEGGALTYLWNFGDGATSTTAKATTTHTYTADGLYTATLTVRDPGGKTGSKTTQISVGDLTGASDPSHVVSSSTPGTGPIGQVFTIKSTLRNDGAADPFTARFEIRDTSNNAKVFEKLYQSETIANGAQKDYTFTWQPGQAAIYKLVVKLESIDGATTFETTDPALTINVFERQPGVEFAPAVTGSAADPAPYTVGTPVNASITVHNTGDNGAADVLIEIYRDVNGTITPVKTQSYPNEAISSGGTRQFTVGFTPSAEGTYYMDAGLFSAGGATMYQWNWRLRSFTVGAGGTTTPPSTNDVVYADAPGAGWDNWSWAATTQSVTTPVAQGTNALGVTYNDPYGGLYFHIPTYSTAGKTKVTFKVHGGSAGGQVLHFFGTTEAESLPSVDISNYGGAVTAGTWKTYEIPLSALSATNATINGFALMGGRGTIESPYFFDDFKIQ